MVRTEEEIVESIRRMHERNRVLLERKLGMSVAEWNAQVKRAHRLGFEGETAIAFIGLTKEQQDQVLASKWRLAGIPAADIPDIVERDMTPVSYYRLKRNGGLDAQVTAFDE